jgi:hypothetical protein
VRTRLFLISAYLVCLLGCRTGLEKLNDSQGKTREAENALAEKDRQLDDKSKAYLHGGIAAVNRMTNEEPAKLVASDLLGKAQLIIGVPSVRDAGTMNSIVGGLLSQVEEERSKAFKLEANYFASVSKLQQDKEELKAVLTAQLEKERAVNAENAEKAAKWDELQKKNFLKRFWGWLTATIGIGGIIALCVLFPPAIPILMQGVGFIVRLVPSLYKWLGVVSSKTFNNVVAGLGSVRTTLKKEQLSGTPRTYTPAEVLQMMDAELAKATDKPDKALIDISRVAVQADRI